MTYFFFILVVQKEYHEKEKVPGWITVKVLNSQKSTYSHLGEEFGITWDNYDRITNPGELGAVFIPTRVVITRGQDQGDEVFCRDPQHTCVADSECDVNNLKLQLPECEAGGCMRRQWCPAEDPDADTSEVHYLDLTDVELWFQTSVHFHKFDLDVATTDERRPRESYRMYGIRFLAFATGIGHKTVFPMIVTQVASALALSTVAGLITDFWMQAILPERKSYTEQKVEQTEDFGDE